ncbi:hypothetical protein E2C01_066237 [Portunus trituberculatus]|uniref:Uncharacterized protein n=1 Tax=Portunus trituberculatus TaxID=210409 RepID=A0A5B7HQH4_PORTR|nr:hypothetical protein [Portunus trituberculatus]
MHLLGGSSVPAGRGGRQQLMHSRPASTACTKLCVVLCSASRAIIPSTCLPLHLTLHCDPPLPPAYPPHHPAPPSAHIDTTHSPISPGGLCSTPTRPGCELR